MSSVNKVILLGNIGHTPKFGRTSESGMAIARFTMATSRRYRSSDGSLREDTQWHQLVAYGRTAEIIRDYVQKGNRLYVDGHLSTRKYTTRDGLEKTITEVICDEIQLFRNEKKEEQA